jgi:hypothetical protein
MPRSQRVGRTTALGVALAVVSAVAVSAAPVSADPEFEVVASGLNNPRHVSFSPTGALYVVEAGEGGSGPCVEHPQLGEFCLGFSGAVTRVDEDGPDERVLTGVPSIINEEGETLGPSDIAFTGSQKFVLSVGLGGSDEFRAGFGSDGALLGTLVTGKLRHGGFSLFADVLANEAAANPDGTDIDSNPVGLVRQGEGYIVADAGGNAVVRASHKNTFTTIAVLPPTSVGADAVPTSVVRGPDGAYYISQLTGFPFVPGAANIWRVVPGEEPTVFASGLTNVTDLAFASDGTLYAVEISSIGLLNGPIGALVRVTPGASQHTIVAGDLFAPYGVALTDSAAYVSTCAVCVGGGEVIKIPLD